MSMGSGEGDGVMSDSGRYICQEDNHNKVWEYLVQGANVVYKWGRLGAAMQSKTKSYTSSYAAQSDVSKLVSEKLNKGYKAVSDEVVEKEVKLARMLGTGCKIGKMKFVSVKGKNMVSLREYDPAQYVYVEILNSYTRQVTSYLLNKEKSWQLYNVVSGGGPMSFGQQVETNLSTVKAVRTYLKDMFRKVEVAIAKATVGVGAGLGMRKLFDDEEMDTEAEQEMVSAFVGLGKVGRKLEL